MRFWRFFGDCGEHDIDDTGVFYDGDKIVIEGKDKPRVKSKKQINLS